MAAPVVIFGGSGGIGSAVAEALVAKGERVHLVGRDVGRLSAAAGRLGATMSVADVEDPQSISRAVDEAADVGGGALQGLCYAVGTINLKPIARLTDADFERDFTVNA